jgi:hypothetical protein
MPSTLGQNSARALQVSFSNNWTKINASVVNNGYKISQFEYKV